MNESVHEGVNLIAKERYYRLIASVLLGLAAFVGLFFSSSLAFEQVSINFPWLLILPMLVTLSWGPKYGIISISFGLVFLYPFFLGSYNGWASLVPSASLFLWIGLHGWGANKRAKYREQDSTPPLKFNLYVLQLLYSFTRLGLYLLFFSLLIELNPPFWNPYAYKNIEQSIVLLFALKGIFVETIFVALCDVLLLLPAVRKLFQLTTPREAKYNTRITALIVLFGLIFTLVVSIIQTVVIDRGDLTGFFLYPNEKTKLTLILSVILFIIMAGVTVRFVQRLLATQERLIRRKAELKKALNELEMLNQELEERVDNRTQALSSSVEELESFAQTITHDLKAPLRAIEGYCQMLEGSQTTCRLDPESKAMVLAIEQTGEDMMRLIERLLDYATTSKKTLHTQPTELSDIFKQMANDFRVSEPTMNIQADWLGDTPTLVVDPVLMKELFGNLFSNAVKFATHPHSLRITLRCSQVAKGYNFAFADDGIGFDMHYANKLFQLFQRMHTRDEYEGHGVGLATMKKIVERHGGNISITSAPGKGTTLLFWLPQKTSPDQETEK